MNQIQNIIFYNTLGYRDEKVKSLRELAASSSDDEKDCMEMTEKINAEWETIRNIVHSTPDLTEMRKTIRSAIPSHVEVGVRSFVIEQIRCALADF